MESKDKAFKEFQEFQAFKELQEVNARKGFSHGQEALSPVEDLSGQRWQQSQRINQAIASAQLSRESSTAASSASGAANHRRQDVSTVPSAHQQLPTVYQESTGEDFASAAKGLSQLFEQEPKLSSRSIPNGDTKQGRGFVPENDFVEAGWMHDPTPQLCEQQTRLMTALQSQLQVLVNAIGNNEQTRDPEAVAKLASSMELSTVYMTATMSLGGCRPLSLSPALVGAAHAEGAAVGEMPVGTFVEIQEPHWPTQEEPKRARSKEISTMEIFEKPVLAHIEVPTEEKHHEQGRKAKDTDNFKDEARDAKMNKSDTINIKTEDENGLYIEGVVPEWKLNTRLLLRQWWFEPAVGLIIAINALTIGIRTVAARNGDDPSVFLDVMEWFFFMVYTSELSARLLAFGLPVLQSRWVQFDAFIVCAMIIDIFINLLPSSTKAGGGDILSTVTVVRLCRIARLARILRLFGSFGTLWTMVQGLMGSAKTLMWTGVILFVILYIFGILGMEIIQVDPEASDHYNATVEYYFPDFMTTMMTMYLLGLTMDDIGTIYRGLILERPLLFVYFVALFMVVSIALLNLTMTLMVDEQMKMAAADEGDKKEKKLSEKRDTLNQLAMVFRQLDKDGSGNVDKHELESGPPEVYDAMCKVIGKDDPNEIIRIFEMLDYSNNGELTIEEFCQGLLQMISGEPVELNILIRQCKHLRSLAGY